jgi:hypothetical protein
MDSYISVVDDALPAFFSTLKRHLHSGTYAPLYRAVSLIRPHYHPSIVLRLETEVKTASPKLVSGGEEAISKKTIDYKHLY